MLDLVCVFLVFVRVCFCSAVAGVAVCCLLIVSCWLLAVVADDDVVVDNLNHEEFAFT